MVMLARFVPWGVRDPEFHVAPPSNAKPLANTVVGLLAALAAVVSAVAGLLTMALLEAIRSHRAGRGFDWMGQLAGLLAPQSLGGWTTVLGIGSVSLTVALATAATLVARRGITERPKE
jgi:PAT family beta-lactamase induction signal transducer AmpG